MGLPALLHYEDRNSMRWSIETRLPYLDPRLVQMSLEVPEDLILNKGSTKVILRQAVAGIVPQNRHGVDCTAIQSHKGSITSPLREKPSIL